jgi:hypothetical protein
MKYALLVHVNKETAEQFKDSSAKAAAAAAGKAYGEALRAAGIFVAGAGLESPQTTTRVSVRDGKRQVHDGPYAERISRRVRHHRRARPGCCTGVGSAESRCG